MTQSFVLSVFVLQKELKWNYKMQTKKKSFRKDLVLLTAAECFVEKMACEFQTKTTSL